MYIRNKIVVKREGNGLNGDEWHMRIAVKWISIPFSLAQMLASQSATYSFFNSIRCSKKKSIIFPIDGFSNLYLVLYKCDRVTPNGVRKIRFRTKKNF